MFKRVYIIINPASGVEEPILSYINKSLQNTNIFWEIALTRKRHDAFSFTKQALRKEYDLIVVYGGDGTVMEVAQALYKQKLPLLILPGGTNNVIANELGISSDVKQALELLKTNSKIKVVDMGLLGRQPFLIRINNGIFAGAVKDTSRLAKDRYWKFAYAMSGIKHMMNHTIFSYTMTIDGKKITDTGVALMLANAGNMGIPGFSLLPRIKIDDGYLDVILFKNAAVHSFMSLAKSIIFGKKPQGSVKHWRGKNITIHISPKQDIICDDVLVSNSVISAKIVPKALHVITP